MEIELAQVDNIISKHGTERGALINLLLDIQDQFFYLPQEALERVAEKMDVPTAETLKKYGFDKFESALAPLRAT